MAAASPDSVCEISREELAYYLDPATPSNVAAATASAAFANGVADVKFNFDGLTVLQAQDFMRRVKEAVERRENQCLSTQFNLNRQLVDDRGGERRIVNEPAAIALLAVEMTRAGGWERVTLDSASSTRVSTPLVKLLEFGALMTWVNKAHDFGLETYISGGMSVDHIELAVHAGVDGVGIGCWIHCCEMNAGSMAALDPVRISSVISERNKAEASTPGLAARLLAKLHVQHPAWSDAEAISRADLLRAALARDEEGLVPLVKHGMMIGLL